MEEMPDKMPPISFADSVEAKVGVPLDSSVIQGVQVIFCMDDNKDIVERVNGAFDILFEEVMKDRDMNRGKIEKS